MSISAVDAFGVVTGAIGGLDQIRQLVTEIHERYRLEKQVPEKCDKVNEGLDEIHKILQELQRFMRETYRGWEGDR